MAYFLHFFLWFILHVFSLWNICLIQCCNIFCMFFYKFIVLDCTLDLCPFWMNFYMLYKVITYRLRLSFFWISMFSCSAPFVRYSIRSPLNRFDNLCWNQLNRYVCLCMCLFIHSLLCSTDLCLLFPQFYNAIIM